MQIIKLHLKFFVQFLRTKTCIYVIIRWVKYVAIEKSLSIHELKQLHRNKHGKFHLWNQIEKKCIEYRVLGCRSYMHPTNGLPDAVTHVLKSDTLEHRTRNWVNLLKQTTVILPFLLTLVFFSCWKLNWFRCFCRIYYAIQYHFTKGLTHLS